MRHVFRPRCPQISIRCFIRCSQLTSFGSNSSRAQAERHVGARSWRRGERITRRSCRSRMGGWRSQDWCGSMPGDNSVGSAADNKVRLPASGPAHVGVLHLEGTTCRCVRLRGGFPAGLLVDGKPAQAQELHTSSDNDKGNPRMTIGSLNFYAVRRGERFALRIKDAKSAALVGFHGLKWYPAE